MCRLSPACAVLRGRITLRPYKRSLVDNARRCRMPARTVLRGRITLRPYRILIDSHNVYCLPSYGRNVMRPFFCAACRPHGPRALSAGRLSCASVPCRGAACNALAVRRMGICVLYGRNVMRPFPVGALHATPLPQRRAYTIIFKKTDASRCVRTESSLIPITYIAFHRTDAT